MYYECARFRPPLERPWDPPLLDRDRDRMLELRRRGTFAPLLRASLKPMAMACFRLFTRPPLPPGPLLRVPRFRRRIALSTLRLAPAPYLRPLDERRRDDFRVAAMFALLVERAYP
jgi:hypothetical protein